MLVALHIKPKENYHGTDARNLNGILILLHWLIVCVSVMWSVSNMCFVMIVLKLTVLYEKEFFMFCLPETLLSPHGFCCPGLSQKSMTFLIPILTPTY